MKWPSLDKRKRLVTEDIPPHLTLHSVWGFTTITYRKMVGHAKVDKLENQGMVDIAASAGDSYGPIAAQMRQARRELEQRAKREGVSIEEMRKRIQAEAEDDPVKAALAAYSRRAIVETFIHSIDGQECSQEDHDRLNNEAIDKEASDHVCSRALVIGGVVKETDGQRKNA